MIMLDLEQTLLLESFFAQRPINFCSNSLGKCQFTLVDILSRTRNQWEINWESDLHLLWLLHDG